MTQNHDQHVAAGRARWAQLVAAGPDALAEHQRRAALAREAKQRALPLDEYRTRKRRGYDGLVAKIGPHAARALLAERREQHRQRRLRHPSRGEQALHQLLRDWGYTVTPLVQRLDWRECQPMVWLPSEAVVEAYCGGYMLDVLIVRLGLVIEIDGYWHQFHRQADADRDRYLESCGLRVIRIPEADILDRAKAESILALHLPRHPQRGVR